MEDQEQEMKWQGQIWNHICGSVDSIVLKCAIELGIFDIIHSSAGNSMNLTLSELSKSLSLLFPNKPENLYRLLRYLSHMNLITITTVEENEIFSLTDLSKLLLRNQEKSLRDWAIGITDELTVSVWHELGSFCSNTTDSTPFEKVHGKTAWELPEENSRLNMVINNMMASDTRLIMPAIIQGCGKVFDGITSLVDIGGGVGIAMSYIVKSFHHIKCTVFDLPHVVNSITEYPVCVDMVGGDMFVSIPCADAILLKYILHNWEDEGCAKILEKCREAIPAEGGNVIIIEIVIDQDGDDDNLAQAKLSLDLDMMVCSGGRERTKDEWKKLLEKAGFSRIEIIPICGIQSVIVAQPYLFVPIYDSSSGG